MPISATSAMRILCTTPNTVTYKSKAYKLTPFESCFTLNMDYKRAYFIICSKSKYIILCVMDVHVDDRLL